MYFDPHTNTPIHADGIWTGSDCLRREYAIADIFTAKFLGLGFTPMYGGNRVWQRGAEKIIVCLVDDIRSCSYNYHVDLPYLFDRAAIVITDNYIGCPTQYRLINLPHSFFGIYDHTPPEVEWTPDRDFSFGINRIDQRRLKLMLEIANRVHLYKGYINFNCQKEFVGDASTGAAPLPSNFTHFWNEMAEVDRAKQQNLYDVLLPMMPLKNYDITHEEIYTHSYLNIVVESYSSDGSAAFSEKIFRALVTPVPWTAYVGRYGIAYLESLGFDCMSDIIDHNHYDRLKEVESKINIFIWKSLEAVKDIKRSNFAQLQERCKRAADTNLKLLASYKQRFDNEFEDWQNINLTQLM